jgi:hypothetical protein
MNILVFNLHPAGGGQAFRIQASSLCGVREAADYGQWTMDHGSWTTEKAKDEGGRMKDEYSCFQSSSFKIQDSSFFTPPSPPKKSGAWGGEMVVRRVMTSGKVRFWQAEHAPEHFAKNALNSRQHKG